MYRNSLEGHGGSTGAVGEVPFEELASKIWDKIMGISIVDLEVVDLKIDHMIPDQVETIIKMALVEELKKKIIDATDIKGNEANIKQIAGAIATIAVDEAIESVTSTIDPMVASVIEGLDTVSAIQLAASGEDINGVTMDMITGDTINLTYLALQLGSPYVKSEIQNKIYGFTVDAAVEMGLIEEIVAEPMADIGQIIADTMEYAKTIAREPGATLNQCTGQVSDYLDTNLIPHIAFMGAQAQSIKNSTIASARRVIEAEMNRPTFTAMAPAGVRQMSPGVLTSSQTTIPDTGGAMLPLALGAGLIGLLLLLR